VIRNGEEVLCYTDGREQAQQVDKLIRSLAEEHGWHAEIKLEHWHESEASWSDETGKAPHPNEARDAEAHRKLVQAEREESLARGYPEWEVRVEFPSHHEAREMEAKLQREGIPSAHRWKYLVVGAWDEDMAERLAKRIRAEMPQDATTTVEASARAVWEEMPRSPFSIFGSLAA